MMPAVEWQHTSTRCLLQLLTDDDHVDRRIAYIQRVHCVYVRSSKTCQPQAAPLLDNDQSQWASQELASTRPR
jgi:hypothetical protein